MSSQYERILGPESGKGPSCSSSWQVTEESFVLILGPSQVALTVRLASQKGPCGLRMWLETVLPLDPATGSPDLVGRSVWTGLPTDSVLTSDGLLQWRL